VVVTAEKIRVLLVDDHTILREGIRALLALSKDMEVVGEAADGQAGLEQVAELQPDVVLMDIAMPGLDGLEATRRIKDRHRSVKVLILTQHENREYVFPILKAGADGYVLKKAAGTELVSAIRAVHEGGTFLYPSVARTVVEDYLRPDGTVGDRRHPKLTDREIEVLKLVAEGRGNQEIADMLCLSVKTVTGHRTNIMEKLDIHSRTELVKYAIRTGLIQV
jgi:DNA-binding NarL/FixJ family response regulator